jgi:hypothetical protein
MYARSSCPALSWLLPRLLGWERSAEGALAPGMATDANSAAESKALMKPPVPEAEPRSGVVPLVGAVRRADVEGHRHHTHHIAAPTGA